MSQLETMERYLRAHMQRTQRPLTPSDRPRPFITISRQAGAGGHSMAATILEVFSRQPDHDFFGGWQVFDRELCQIAAKDPTYSRSLESLLAEQYRSRTNEIMHQVLWPTYDQKAVLERVFRVVRSVATIGKAVIIGRAGSEVTRDMGPGISIRLVAPVEVRVRGLMELGNLTERAALKEIHRLDDSRARLLRDHFHVDIEDPTRYDAVFNAGRVSLETIAEALVVMLSTRAGIPAR